jgi:putative transposase
MLPPEPLPVPELAVGVDVGLTTFAVISDGTEIANPRHFRAAERRLRLAQRKLARRSKRSCLSMAVSKYPRVADVGPR